MKYTWSDLADWWDATADEYWNEQDDFVIQANNLGDAHPVFVFAAWYNNYINSVPRRVPLAVAGGLADVLRLGNDLELDSVGGFLKGVALNVLRVLTVVQPLASGMKNEIRHQGMLAIAKVAEIKGSPLGPCQYTAFNNIASFLKGRTLQYFADLDDIVSVGGTADKGIFIKQLLEHPNVAKFVGSNGIQWREIPALKTIDDVINAAKNTENPIRFEIEWADDALNYNSHALVALKDLKGRIRIIDYAEGTPDRMGFFSWDDLVTARRSMWGKGLEAANLRTDIGTLPQEFTSQFIKVLHFAEDKFAFALPLAIGIKWIKGGANQNADQAAPSVIDSATQFFERKYGAGGFPSPESLYPPPVQQPYPESVMGVHTVEGPGIKYEDWLSNIAKKWYGDMLLWPILFDYNKGPDFMNPNKMYVGQRVKIPFILDKTTDELKAYRKRGYDWR